MTLVDTGPIVALFDPGDSEHLRCRRVLESLRGPLVTTLPVDRTDFSIYRWRLGLRLMAFEILS